MAKQYSAEFKLEAVRRYEVSAKSIVYYLKSLLLQISHITKIEVIITSI